MGFRDQLCFWDITDLATHQEFLVVSPTAELLLDLVLPNHFPAICTGGG